MLEPNRTLIALTALALILGAVRSARADPTADERDRAAASHSRDRSSVRSRVAGSSGAEAAAAPAAVPQDPQLLCDAAACRPQLIPI